MENGEQVEGPKHLWKMEKQTLILLVVSAAMVLATLFVVVLVAATTSNNGGVSPSEEYFSLSTISTNVTGKMASSEVIVIPTWEVYKRKYGKRYGNKEDETRKALYERNVAEILVHNSLYEKGSVSYGRTVDESTDMEQLDLSAKRKGVIVPLNVSEMDSKFEGVSLRRRKLFKKAINWAKEKPHCMLPVRDQGLTTLAMRRCITYGHPPIQYSIQHLVNCDKSNHGCNGGWPTAALKWIQANYVTKDADYPYVESELACSNNANAEKIHGQDLLAGAYQYSGWGEGDLLRGIQTGPVIVLTALNRNLESYKKGIFDNNDDQFSGEIGHALTVIGYTEEYWIAQNSWGTQWGEDGFIRIKRTKSGYGVIGINLYAIWPRV